MKNAESNSFSTFLSSPSCANFQEIPENPEFDSRETSSSESCIWSNICRIEMKSGGLERWNFSNFVTHCKHTSTNSIPCYFRKNLVYIWEFLECRKFFDDSESVVSETLFSVANTWANICRIDMKSTWLDSLNSEVFEQSCGGFVGPFAPEQAS